jgi:hypothetical protein
MRTVLLVLELLLLVHISKAQTNVTGLGLGCFGLPSQPFDCNCDEAFCSSQNCTVSFHAFIIIFCNDTPTHLLAFLPYPNKDAGGTFTDRCSSCQCSGTLEEQTNVTVDQTNAIVLGVGCFGLPSQPFYCSCDEVFCSSQNCTVRCIVSNTLMETLENYVSSHSPECLFSLSKKGCWWYFHG